MAKKALGKGLGALIKTQSNSAGATNSSAGDKVLHVAIDKVIPSPLQPRKHIPEGHLDELLDSIREHGIIQPLIVRKVDNKYELIAGERRWRASTKLGLKTVPLIIRVAGDQEVLEMALIENLQREDLNPIEEAAGYVRLAKEFGMKQEAIAKRVGKSRASVANAMRLLDLHPDIQIYVANTKLSVGHAKAILSLKKHELQLMAADQILTKKLTVRAAEKLAQTLNRGPLEQKANDESNREMDATIQNIQTKLQANFSTKINISHGAKKGKIELEYYGQEDLHRIIELLGIQVD